MAGDDARVPVGAASLAKGLKVLNLVSEADSPIRFAELHRLSGLPKATFNRILRTLVAFELVSKGDGGGAYTLGRRCLELSQKAWDAFDIAAASVPELEKLSSELGETAALCRIDDGNVIYLDERSGAGLCVRVDAGRRAPLHCTAAGKALLAFMDPTASQGLIQRLDFDGITESTIRTVEALQADMALTRARGYAVSYEEHLPGVNSVACVIAGRDGSPLGALAALGPSSRFDESRLHPAGRELIAAARRITGQAGFVAISPRPRRRRLKSVETTNLECVLPWGAQLGEAPVWHHVERRLYWVDILHPAVFRFDPSTGVNRACTPKKLVSAVLPGQGGALRVASQDGIEQLDFENCRLIPNVDPETGQSQNRLNDAKVGPDGAIWVGSMRLDASKPTGVLYRISPDGRVERKDSGIKVSNGLDWSPDKRTFYFVDTVPGRIYAFDFDRQTGNLENKRVFAEIPESEGRPGGLCVDSDGGIWCAIWDGWRVNRFAPDGSIDRIVDLPVPRPTSVAFGGTDFSELYMTTARTRLPASALSDAPLSGGIFACTPGPVGLPAELFA